MFDDILVLPQDIPNWHPVSRLLHRKKGVETGCHDDVRLCIVSDEENDCVHIRHTRRSYAVLLYLLQFHFDFVSSRSLLKLSRSSNSESGFDGATRVSQLTAGISNGLR